MRQIAEVFFESEAVKHDLIEFKVQCLKVFCCHGNKSTILLFNSIVRTAPEASTKLYFVEISYAASLSVLNCKLVENILHIFFLGQNWYYLCIIRQ